MLGEKGGICKNAYIEGHIKSNRRNRTRFYLYTSGRDTDSGVDPKVAQQLFSVAEWLIAGFGVRRVAIMQLLHRSRTRHVGVHRFNETIDVINEQLKQLCHSNNACFYWRHKGMKEGLNGCLSPDGVHMNQAGLRKFCLSLLGAILFAAKPRST